MASAIANLDDNVCHGLYLKLEKDAEVAAKDRGST